VASRDRNISRAISLLNQIVITRAKQLESDQLNPQHFIVLGHCCLLLSDFPNAFAAANVTRIGGRVEDPDFWYRTGSVYRHFNYNADANRYMKQALQLWTQIPRKADLVLGSASTSGRWANTTIGSPPSRASSRCRPTD
jgi:hypothetical protein